VKKMLLKRIGRLLSIIGAAAFASLFLLAIPSVREAANATQRSRDWLALVAIIAAVGAFLPWGLAIWDWATSAKESRRWRRMWGLALSFGGFVGAWAYWMTHGDQARAERRLD
jgi:4-amino-4-deoxy-L-arabinose transferase-like glycosyltransferase